MPITVVCWNKRAAACCAFAVLQGIFAFAIACGFSCLAAAGDLNKEMSFDIPAQPLSQALADFSRQADTNVVATTDVTSGKTSRAVNAITTPVKALEMMLEGTNLQYKQGENGAIIVSQPIAKASEENQGLLRVAQAGESAAASDQSPEQQKAESAERLEEIVVTAQKRAQRLTDVPISITALSGAQLDRSRAEGLSEQLNRIPGVTTVPAFQSGGTQITVRGATAAGPNFFGSNPIAYYVDGLPFALVRSAGTPDMSPYDLDRLEVLRGPQGTLYGASALNGVVRVLTHKPDLTELDFKARTAISQTEDGGLNYRADMAVNLPIVDDVFAARLVVGYQNLSGWIDRPGNEDANDSKVKNARLKLRAEPTDRLSLNWSSWFTRGDASAPPYALDNGTFPVTSRDEPLGNDFDQHGLTVEYDFGRFSLTSTTGYLEYGAPGRLDLNAPPIVPWTLFTGIHSEIFSQEVFLASTGEGPWRWTLGALYRDGEDHTVQSFTDNATGLQPEFARRPYEFWDSSESIAVFGELTKVLLDGALEVTGGLRYFEDEVPGKEGLIGQPPVLETSASFDKVTPRVIFAWHPSTQTMAYASYSQGFRSGFDQYSIAKTDLGLPPLKPDTLTNYEVGTRGSGLQGRFRYDAALYFIEWKDVQYQFTVVAGDPPVPGAANINAGDASGIGVDLGLDFEVNDNFNLALSAGWNDLTFDQTLLSGNTGQEIYIAKGDRLNSSPELTVSAAAEYAFPVGSNGFRGQFAASANYISEQQVASITPAGPPITLVGDDLAFARASFGLESPSHWRATLFVDNLTNEDGAPIEQMLSPAWNVRARPRTIGVQFEYRFARR
jgi:iron complex outermembrane recepter protein